MYYYKFLYNILKKYPAKKIVEFLKKNGVKDGELHKVYYYCLEPKSIQKWYYVNHTFSITPSNGFDEQVMIEFDNEININSIRYNIIAKTDDMWNCTWKTEAQRRILNYRKKCIEKKYNLLLSCTKLPREICNMIAELSVEDVFPESDDIF